MLPPDVAPLAVTGGREIAVSTRAGAALRHLEDGPPVDILEFIDSDKYLNYGQFLYPRLRFFIELFYHPERYEEYLRNEIGVPPEQFPLKFKEFIFFAGYKSGKTTLIGVLCLYELYRLLCLEDPQAYYRQAPEQEFFITSVATSEEQAKDTIWSHIVGLRATSPWFQRYEESLAQLKDSLGPLFRSTGTILEYRHKSIVARVMHSRSAGLVGRTSKCVALDEIAKMEEGVGSRSANRIYSSLRSTTTPFGDDGIVAAISNPLHAEDMICTLYGRCAVRMAGETFLDLYVPSELIA